jgi:hypothetical protein
VKRGAQGIPSVGKEKVQNDEVDHIQANKRKKKKMGIKKKMAVDMKEPGGVRLLSCSRKDQRCNE